MTTTEIKTEYVKDTFAEYLGKKDHISSSDIKNFLKSPLVYYTNKFGEEKEKSEERHFSIGSACHELILEPELFNKNYIISPKVDRRTKEGKQQYADFVAQSEGKTILFEDEMQMVIKMAENASQNNTFIELMKDSYRELSVYTTDPITNLKLRMRPDILPINKSTIVDIKTCVDSSPRKFKNDVYNHGYSLSAAYYSDFIKRENYIFAAVEKEPPYQMSLYALSDEMIEYGRQQYRMGLDLLKWSFDNNFWCNYNQFEMLKESYQLGNLDSFFDTLEKSQLITIL